MFKNIVNYLKKNTNLTQYIKQNKFLPYHLFFVIVYSLIYYSLSKTIYFKDSEGYHFNSYFDCFTYSLLLHFTIGPIFITPPKTTTFKLITISQVLLSFTLMQV